MPAWPRVGPPLVGLNFWLVALVIPVLISGAALRSPLSALLALPLAPLLFVPAWRSRQRLVSQVVLLVFVPLAVLVPPTVWVDAFHSVLLPRLWSPPVICVDLLLLTAYLAVHCRSLALHTDTVPSEGAPLWTHRPLPQASSTGSRPPGLDRRRLWAHRLLMAYALVLPAVSLAAVGFYRPHVRALLGTAGSFARIGMVQATLLASSALVLAVAYYFCLLPPLVSYLEHHEHLRRRLRTLARSSSRKLPPVTLWVALGMAMLAVAGLFGWLILWKPR